MVQLAIRYLATVVVLAVCRPCFSFRERTGAGWTREGMVRRGRESLGGGPWKRQKSLTSKVYSGFITIQQGWLSGDFFGDPSEDRSCRKLVITSLLVTAVAILLSQTFHGMEMLGLVVLVAGGHAAPTEDLILDMQIIFGSTFPSSSQREAVLLPFLRLGQTMPLLCHKLAASPGQEWGACFSGQMCQGPAQYNFMPSEQLSKY